MVAHNPAMVAALRSQYPNVDSLMAETLVMMHEQGKLMPLLKAGEEKVPPVERGHISIKDEEKATVSNIEWSEDKCQD